MILYRFVRLWVTWFRIRLLRLKIAFLKGISDDGRRDR